MNAAYTVPSGATATAGSHAFTFEPTDSGTEVGVSKLAPRLTERANAIPLHPIQVSYTYPRVGCTACPTSAFWPEHEELMSVIGTTAYVAASASAGLTGLRATVPAR